MKYSCCDRLRRNAVAAHPTLNGIDYLEVLDRDLPDSHPFRQRTLFVHFLKPVSGLNADNVRLTGGDRVRNVRIEWAAPGVPAPAALTGEEATLLGELPDEDRVLVVRTDSTGDHSKYALQLVETPQADWPPPGFDPQLAAVEFSFKVECPSDFDCRIDQQCREKVAPSPEINYLARDYASFRRVMLDRLSQLMPGWSERSAADTAVALVELLAYVGDHLTYRQDAAATEAYLGTARKRISLRRHALLVDYAMHDGCNARTWIQLQVTTPSVMLLQGDTQFFTECPGIAPLVAPGSSELARAMRQHPEVFEPLHDATLRSAHNAIPLYTWGDRRCCLPRGATSATLEGHHADLAPGDPLLFEELKGPTTGELADANPLHRQVVRLTSVRHTQGSAHLTDPLTGTEITEIAWADEDALSFALCISAVTDEHHGSLFIDGVSIARGNLVLADHGRSIRAESVGTVPAPTLLQVPANDGDRCEPASPVPVPARVRPSLAERPLTQAGRVWRQIEVDGVMTHERVPFDPDAPATHATRWAMADVLPAVELLGTLGADQTLWSSRRNLLNSAGNADEFVAEIDEDGSTFIRFGDDVNGHRPEQETAFTADYRVGNGTAGNVGADSIVHAVTIETAISEVRNPLPAAGGVEPESAESVRRRAPEAFRRQERAVTEEDYAEVSTRHVDVAHAAATLRWTGSWHTVFVTADREGGAPMTADFTGELGRHLDRYRMAGHDLNFHEPEYVPLALTLDVCVKPDHFRSEVRRTLDELFSGRVMRDGRRGLFHPDNFTFGQPVYLSRLSAAAHAVPGVASAVFTEFRRQHSHETLELEEGRIAPGRLEIARMDNDPNNPERGVLTLDLHGGK